MSTQLQYYRDTILKNPNLGPHDESLLIARDGRLTCCYAPFEDINRSARVVLVGITPGAQQAKNALTALRHALLAGAGDAEALETAKRTASFSGNMRGNLVAMLDRIGLDRALGLDSCASLFGDRVGLVHFTSVLRNPVFLDGADYSGNPAIASSPFLQTLSERWFESEIDALPEALWVPLGKEPTAVLRGYVQRGRLHAERVLDGLPHPSGANAERIAYFLGNKSRNALSAKTDAAALDNRREALAARVALMQAPAITAPTVTHPHHPVAVARPVAETKKNATSRARTGFPATVDQAEGVIAQRLARLKPGNSKVAGFETRLGRHLAIQRDVQCLNVWTEDLDAPAHIADHERYHAQRARHSNLSSQAPRLANGTHARLWRLADINQLVALLDWYERA